MTTYQKRLESIKSSGLYRQLTVLGDECVDFSSNDYLGLSRDRDVGAAIKASIDQEGHSQTASRLISGHTSLHSQFEEKLAKAKGYEASLVFSSGYMANLGVLSALVGDDDLVVIDKLVHASIIDSLYLSGANFRVFPHKNYKVLRSLLAKNCSKFSQVYVVTDGVFSMDGDVADIIELLTIVSEFDGMLIVDDAHGLGVIGDDGLGLTNRHNFCKDRLIETGTLSKSLGLNGGYVCGSSTVIDLIINVSRPFIYDTALPAYVMAGALVALDKLLSGELRDKLWENIRYMSHRLVEIGFDCYEPCSAIIPMMMKGNDTVSQFSGALKNEGYYVPAIRYPTVKKGKERLRLTVSASHSFDQIDGFIKALASINL
jgi:8-amino-7-oxononanoate synthase